MVIELVGKILAKCIIEQVNELCTKLKLWKVGGNALNQTLKINAESIFNGNF